MPNWVQCLCVFRRPACSVHVPSFALDMSQQFWSGLSDMFNSSFLHSYHPRDIPVTVVCCFFLFQSFCFPSQTVILFFFLWLSDSLLHMSTSLVTRPQMPQLHFCKDFFYGFSVKMGIKLGYLKIFCVHEAI